MSKLYICLSKLGDVLNVLPMLHKDSLSGDKPTLMVSNQYADVLDGVSYIEPLIFDGEPHELERAVEIAKSTGKEVICTQVVGPKDIVKEFTYDEAVKPNSMATSFQKESWRVAGRLNEWDDCLPLLFDKRSPDRELKLMRDCGAIKKGHQKPIMLLALESGSSPFPYKDLLRTLITLSFKEQYNIIEIPKAERFYDLLGLYEKAAILIAVDSAPLHLAWACQKLPVFVMAQDKPHFWYGSPWRTNHAWYCRYHDFPERATEMIESISNLKPEIKEAVHIWSEYETKRPVGLLPIGQGLAIKPGMCGRDSKNLLQDSKTVPYLRDCIRMGIQKAEGDDSIIVISRSDSELAITKDPSFAYRMTIKDGRKQFRPVVDFFAAKKSFWKEILPSIPDLLLSGDFQWSQCLWVIFKERKAFDLTGLCIRQDLPAKPFKESKTLAHNTRLCAEYMKASKVHSRYPKVNEQVECVPLETDKLNPFGYNPTIAKGEGGMIMAYRWHSGTASTKLSLSVITKDGKISSDTEISIPGDLSKEDAKFFTYWNELYLSFVESQYPKALFSVVKYGKLINGHLHDIIQPEGLGNDGKSTQKNWVYFEHDDKFMFIYQCHPTQKIYALDGLHESPAPIWPYGEIRGGTTPLPYEGKLLRFFHSRINNEIGPIPWRYNIGALLMNPEPPFEVVKVSRKPIIWGSEVDTLTREQRGICFHRKANVVFPGGAIEHGNGWLLAFGNNDCQCMLAKIKPSELNL